MGKDSRRTEAARASEASRVCEHTGHKARRAPQGIGEGKGKPNDPETGQWQSERIIVPRVGSRGLLAGKVGNRCPEGPSGGKEKPGITFFWKDLWEILRDHQPYP